MTDTASSSTASDVIDQVMRLVKGKKFDQVEAAWMACLEQDPIDTEGLLRVAKEMVRQKKSSQAGTLLWAMVESVREAIPAQEVFLLARRAAMAAPGDESLRGEFAELAAEQFADVPRIGELIELAGLTGKVPSDQGIAQLEVCLELTPGRYVYDRQSHRPGRVVELSLDDGRFAVDLEAYIAKYSPQSAVERLELLPDDDFRAMAIFEKERLQELATDDPPGVARLALRAAGGRMEYRQLRKLLADADLLPKSWASWWAKAKTPLRHCPDILVSDDTQPYFVLRRQAVSYEDEVRARLRTADGLAGAIEVVFAYLDHVPRGQAPDPVLAGELAEALDQRARLTAESQPAEALVCLAVRDRIAKRGAELPDVPPQVASAAQAAIEDPAGAVALIHDDLVLDAWLEFVRATREDWPRVYADVMPVARYPVCRRIARELVEADHGDHLAAVAATLQRQPALYPEGFLWLWEVACRGNRADVLGELDRTALTLALVDLTEQVYRSRKRMDDREARRVSVQMRTVMSARGYALVKDVISGMTAAQAAQLRTVLDRNAGLDSKVRTAMVTHLVRTHGSVGVKRLELWEEDVIYSTPEALTKQHEALQHALNVEMPGIGERIGQAASYGDLSENAEYTAALEERDRLSERIGRMRQELDMARAIRLDTVPVDRVSVGARIRVRDGDGQESDMTFLGPWDSDPDNGVYYYRAPLAMALMGHRVGETVEVETTQGTRQIEILAIGRAAESNQ